MNELLDRLVAFTNSEVALSQKPAPIVTPPTPIVTQPGVRKLADKLLFEYSTMYCGNIDHRAFLLLHPGGAIGLHKADGTLHKLLPSEVNHSSQPRWSRTKPTCFYYLYLNQLRMYDVANDQISTIRTFKEFPSINGMGESDLSEDSDHLVLCSGNHVFVYRISSDTISQEFTAPGAFNNLYLDSQNRPLIGLYNGGHQLFDGQLRKVAHALGHMDTSSDKDGSPIMVWANSADDSGANRSAALPNCANGIVKIDIRTDGRLFKQTCLLSLDWSLAVHISLPDHAEFALVSTFDGGNPDSTVPYANENLLVYLDSQNGSHVKSLGKHRSIAKSYETQPHSSVSQDGSRYVYGSNGDVYVGTL